MKKEKSQSETQSYIPGLGLYIHDTKDISYKKYSAGTDCLGFAERAASYKNNIYKWTDLPEGRIEGKDSDSNEREPDPKTTKTHFPQTYLTSMKDNASFLILTKKSIGNAGTSTANAYYVDAVGTKNGPTEEDFKIIKELFQKIIPGDIITYPGHIGIVSEINCNGINRATSIKEIMDNITVAESFYGSTYNYVMKRQSTGGVRYTDVNGNTFNKGSWFFDWNDKMNMRNFKIERLMFN